MNNNSINSVGDEAAVALVAAGASSVSTVWQGAPPEEMGVGI
jgi:hypothetical protein